MSDFRDYKPPGVFPEEAAGPPYDCESCGGQFIGPHVCHWAEINRLKEKVAELEARFETHRHGYRWEMVGKDGKPPVVEDWHGKATNG